MSQMEGGGAEESSEPTLISVVIASVNGLESIQECLDCLVNQEGNVRAEAVVLECCGPETREALARRFFQPFIRVIPVEGRPSIPALRAMGMAQARGRIVAIIEDHCMAHPRWLQVIARAHAAGHRAVGGPVENGSVVRSVDWAVFFCEYARFMLPVPHGIVAEIPGNNSAFDRRVLDALGPELQEEVWEAFLHQKMREAGVEFHSDPEMIVYHKKHFGFGYFLSQRYHYSRSFAGMRMIGAPLWKRLGYAGATTLLPGILLVRITSIVARKGRHWKQYLLSLPSLCSFLVIWAVGEGVGAVLGPGRSLQRVE